MKSDSSGDVEEGGMSGAGKGKQQVTQPPLHKVIMVGSGGVGKSALTLQFMYDEVSDGDMIKTIVLNENGIKII